MHTQYLNKLIKPNCAVFVLIISSYNVPRFSTSDLLLFNSIECLKQLKGFIISAQTHEILTSCQSIAPSLFLSNFWNSFFSSALSSEAMMRTRKQERKTTRKDKKKHKIPDYTRGLTNPRRLTVQRSCSVHLTDTHTSYSKPIDRCRPVACGLRSFVIWLVLSHLCNLHCQLVRQGYRK